MVCLPYLTNLYSSGNVYMITEMYKFKKNDIMVHVPDLQLESELNVLTMVGTI